MEHLIIPDGYSSPLTIRETEVAIKEIKDHFERSLAKALHLTRVSAPLFVTPESGLNDNLNGVEPAHGTCSLPAHTAQALGCSAGNNQRLALG